MKNERERTSERQEKEDAEDEERLYRDAASFTDPKRITSVIGHHHQRLYKLIARSFGSRQASERKGLVAHSSAQVRSHRIPWPRTKSSRSHGVCFGGSTHRGPLTLQQLSTSRSYNKRKRFCRDPKIMKPSSLFLQTYSVWMMSSLTSQSLKSGPLTMRTDPCGRTERSRVLASVLRS